MIGLAMLVLGAIPLARAREQHWSSLRYCTLPCNAVAERFKADLFSLWALTLAVPPAWTTLAYLLFTRH